MKKFILLLSALAMSFGALAQSANSSQQQQTQSTAANEGNNQAITFTSPPVTSATMTYDGSYTIKNVPSVSGPPLTTSNDTCMGSTSGGVNGPGFGVSIGSTWSDTNCKMLKNSREMWNMGLKAASMALLCSDPGNRAALEMTGTICPQSMTNEQRTKAYGPMARMDGQTPIVATDAPTVPVSVPGTAQAPFPYDQTAKLVAYQQSGGRDPIVIHHLGGYATK